LQSSEGVAGASRLAAAGEILLPGEQLHEGLAEERMIVNDQNADFVERLSGASIHGWKCSMLYNQALAIGM
jgi:hypothetical protein